MIKNITITFAAQKAIGMINSLIFSVLSGIFIFGSQLNAPNATLVMFNSLIYIGYIILYFLVGRLFLDRLEDKRKTFISCFAIAIALIAVSLIGLIKIVSTPGNSTVSVSISSNSIAGMLMSSINQIFGMSLNASILAAFASAVISPFIQSSAIWVWVLSKKNKKAQTGMDNNNRLSAGDKVEVQ